MVNSDTQQFMYRVFIGTACFVLAACFVFLFVAALHFGDGEGVKIIDAIQPLAISLLGGLVTTFLGSHAAGAYVAKQQAQVSIATASGGPTSATSVDATAQAAGSGV